MSDNPNFEVTSNADAVEEFVSDPVTIKRIELMDSQIQFREVIEELGDLMPSDPKYTIFKEYQKKSSDIKRSKGIALNYFIKKFINEIILESTSEGYRWRLIEAYKKAREDDYQELLELILGEWIKEGQ